MYATKTLIQNNLFSDAQDEEHSFPLSDPFHGFVKNYFDAAKSEAFRSWCQYSDIKKAIRCSEENDMSCVRISLMKSVQTTCANVQVKLIIVFCSPIQLVSVWPGSLLLFAGYLLNVLQTFSNGNDHFVAETLLLLQVNSSPRRQLQWAWHQWGV